MLPIGSFLEVWQILVGVASILQTEYNIIYIHVCWSSVLLAGEDLWQTAIRETKEEVGIATEFVSVLCFRHMHGYRWGTDDIYFACLLRPLETEIKIDPNEIADAKWMDVGHYSKHIHI